MSEDTSIQTGDLTLPGLIHDLNNVFQTLVEAADMLSDDPRWAPLSAVILRSIERGKNITAGLQAEGSSVPLEAILNNAIACVQDSLTTGRGPNIRFVCEIEPGIELGTLAWERVLFNLFSNAVCAMPGGGSIHIQAARREDRIEMVVRDEGPGIEEGMLREIFKPHVSTKASGGLGLHIVETIVKREGGEVRAANRAGRRGAEFIITLPAQFGLRRAAAEGG